MNYASARTLAALPSFSTIYSNSYVVLPHQLEEDGYDLSLLSKGKIQDFDMLDVVRAEEEEAFRNLVGKIRALARAERKKEIAFLSIVANSPIFMKSKGNNLSEIREELKEAIRNPSHQLGKIFTLINITERELDKLLTKRAWDLYTDRKLNTQLKRVVKEEVTKALKLGEGELRGKMLSSIEGKLNGVNVNIVSLMREAIIRMLDDRKLPKKKLEEVVDNMVVRAGLDKYVPKDMLPAFTKEGDIPLSELINLKKQKEGKDRTINASIDAQFNSILWGMGAEVVVDLAHGRRYGARRSHVGGKGGSDDVIEVFNISGKIDHTEKALANLFGEEDARNYLAEISETLRSFSSKVTLHYNIKDYRFFEKTGMTRTDMRLKSGKAEARLGFINQTTDHDLKGLLFLINNAAAGGLFEGERDKVLRGIAAVAAKWMFTDFDDGIEFPKEGGGENDLHLFVLSGVYYPISTILERLADQLQASVPSEETIVKADGVWPDAGSEYFPIKASIPFKEGKTKRWDALKGFVESETAIKTTLNRTFFDVFNLGGL